MSIRETIEGIVCEECGACSGEHPELCTIPRGSARRILEALKATGRRANHMTGTFKPGLVNHYGYEIFIEDEA